MAKPLDPRLVEYCMDCKWLIEWNTPHRDLSNPDITTYRHYVIVIYELKDENKNLLSHYQTKILLGETKEQLYLDEKAKFLQEKLSDIRDLIVKDKLERAGHEYKGGADVS